VLRELSKVPIRQFCEGLDFALEDKLCKRIEQIQKAHIEGLTAPNTSPLSVSDFWNIAEVVEKTKEIFEKDPGKMFFAKKVSPMETSLFADTGKRVFYVVLKRMNGFIAEGLIKTVRLVIGLPFDSLSSAQSFVQKTNRRRRSGIALDKERARKKYESFKREIRISSKYSCVLTPTLVWEQPYSPDVPGKLRVVEPYLSSMKTFSLMKPSSKDLVDCALSLINGLLELKEDQRIHGDIKLANALWKRTSEGKVGCKWSDLGLSKSFREDDKKTVCLNHWYGTVEYTPPELLGKILSTPNELFRVEAFAAGCLLIQLYYEDSPHWFKDLQVIYQWQLQHVSTQDAEIAAEKIDEIVNQMSSWFKAIQERTTGWTVRDQFKLICLKLMEVDPQQRITLESVKSWLELLKSYVG
jgi:serine/threonine protein kinase